MAETPRSSNQATNPHPSIQELRTANCELRTANCELRTANCELRTENCDCELRTVSLRDFPPFYALPDRGWLELKRQASFPRPRSGPRRRLIHVPAPFGSAEAVHLAISPCEGETPLRLRSGQALTTAGATPALH